MLLASSSVKRTPLPTPPSGRERATSQTANAKGDRMNPGIRILPSTKCQWPSRRADGRIEVRTTSCLQDGKLSLKVDKPQVGQRNEDVEIEWEYYHIIIFSKRTRNFTSRKKRTLAMEHFNGILFHKFGAANKHHTITKNMIIKKRLANHTFVPNQEQNCQEYISLHVHPESWASPDCFRISVQYWSAGLLSVQNKTIFP